MSDRKKSSEALGIRAVGGRIADHGGAALSHQRTLKAPVRCTGIGLHTGVPVTLSLFPAAADHGIVFQRTDVVDRDPMIPARWDMVTQTFHCTAIANEAGVSVSTIEHLMAALAGLGIDNALVTVDGPEVPIMDGSSAPFVFLVECAGTVELAAQRRVVRVLRPVSIIENGGRVAKLSPATDGEGGLTIGLQIDFNSAAVSRQEFEFRVTDGSFKADIARARTFGFLHEVDSLRAAGLALGGSLDNAVVVSGDQILNEDGLRYDDEFVRHKVLDCIGDLALAGFRIEGRFHGERSGHALNNKLLRALFADPANYTITTPSEAAINVPAWQQPGIEGLEAVA